MHEINGKGRKGTGCIGSYGYAHPGRSLRDFPVGTRVRTRCSWAGVPVGTKGTVVRLYEDFDEPTYSGVVVEWDAPVEFEDGFSQSEQRYLESIAGEEGPYDK